jgi:Bacterial DNA polymerase III alpha subunit finger domain
MATVLSPADQSSRTVLAVRIGENDNQPDRLRELLELAGSPPSPEAVLEAETEVAAIREAGLGRAVSEILTMADDLRRAGLPLEVAGKAGGIRVFHLAGLTALDPREHGFLAETFLDIPAAAPNALPAGNEKHGWPVFGVRLATGLDDFMAYLRRQGYSFRVRRVGVDLPCDKILAGRRHPYGDRITPTLFVAAGSDLPAAASLRRDELSACLRDTQTFQLLAAGDTAGLGQLEEHEVRAALRKEKPTSIGDLAGILATASLPLEWMDSGAVYEEDTMLELRSLLGISLTDAKRLIASRGRWDGTADQHRGWFVETAGRQGMAATEAEDRWQRLGNEVRRMRSRSAMFEKAYRCLKAAYVKAHYPEEFGAMGAAWRG